MKKVVILRGVSGAGKSTYAKKIQKEFLKEVPCSIVSADFYSYDKEGKYNFDPSKLPEAHAQCLRDFVTAVVSENKGVLIVDNTNCSLTEVAPYLATAQAFGFEVEVVNFVIDTQAAANRTVHGTPLGAIDRQQHVYKDANIDWPRWWPEALYVHAVLWDEC